MVWASVWIWVHNAPHHLERYVVHCSGGDPFHKPLFKCPGCLHSVQSTYSVALFAGRSQSAVDKTARKIAALEQLVGSPPPDFDDLDAFLYEEPTVKLPVANAKYCSLIADNEALMSKIEPESKSEAAALARVVTVALETEYEPVADELVLAGVLSTFEQLPRTTWGVCVFDMLKSTAQILRKNPRLLAHNSK